MPLSARVLALVFMNHCQPVIFILRQHATACRVRYCYSKSVRPSVCLSVTLWYYI